MSVMGVSSFTPPLLSKPERGGEGKNKSRYLIRAEDTQPSGSGAVIMRTRFEDYSVCKVLNGRINPDCYLAS